MAMTMMIKIKMEMMMVAFDLPLASSWALESSSHTSHPMKPISHLQSSLTYDALFGFIGKNMKLSLLTSFWLPSLQEETCLWFRLPTSLYRPVDAARASGIKMNGRKKSERRATQPNRRCSRGAGDEVQRTQFSIKSVSADSLLMRSFW